MGEDSQRQGKPDRRPTAGELRRRLAEMGHPWKVDPKLRDDEEVPDYARGGELVEDLPGIERVEEDFDEVLRRDTPSNSFLRARWAEAGLLKPDEPDRTPQIPPTAPDRPTRPERGSEGQG